MACKTHVSVAVISAFRNCNNVLKNKGLHYGAFITRCRGSRSYGSDPGSRLQWSYAQGAADTPFRGITIGKLLQDRCELHPDKTAYIFCEDNIKKSFSQLLLESDQLAAGLVSLGLKKGDRVGIWGPNSWEWILAQYATARTGMILVNINPQYRLNELEYALNKVECKALISAERFKDQDYYEMLFDIMPELAAGTPGALHSHILPDLKILIMMGNSSYPGSFKFDEVMEAGSSQIVQEIFDMQNRLQFDDPINIQFTSGTTGFPKGAALTHHNIVNNSFYIGRKMDYHNRDTRICIPVPLYHCFGMVIGSLMTANFGACCVFPSRSFDAGKTLTAVETERCTSLYGVPTMFIDMLNHPEFAKFDLSSLNTGVMAGSPCPIETMQQVIERMHMPDVTVCYGSTETSPVTFQSAMDDEIDKRVSTVGRPHDQTEAKIILEDGSVAPVGTPGELCTRGYTTMLGYWNDHDKTTEAVSKEGWYHTGDIGEMDDQGFCKIVGRIKDMIIRGGENIYPVEIEQVLYRHPKIKDVQVVGVPDKRLGEDICAWIEVKDGETVTPDEIKEFCKDKMARFKIPRYVQFVDSYPLTVTGKVQKFKIRESATKILGLEHTRP